MRKKLLPTVIFPLIKLASFCVSIIAAIGIDQVAKGPQKWVLLKTNQSIQNRLSDLKQCVPC